MPTVKQYADALIEAQGMLSVAARHLGVSRQAIYLAAKKHPTVQEAIDDARENTGDTAELKLFEAIKAGEPWAVQFYLKTQGKRRGYIERQEITGAEGNELTIRIKRE